MHVAVSFDIRIALDPLHPARSKDKSYEFVDFTSDDNDDDKQCGDKRQRTGQSEQSSKRL